MELDFGTGHIGYAVGTADHWPTRRVTFHDDTRADCESIDIHVKRAAVLSVWERSTEGSALEEGASFRVWDGLYSHYSEVLDPPVSIQIHEGVSDCQPDPGPRHQSHRRPRQPHVHQPYAGTDGFRTVGLSFSQNVEWLVKNALLCETVLDFANGRHPFWAGKIWNLDRFKFLLHGGDAQLFPWKQKKIDGCDKETREKSYHIRMLWL